MVAFVAVAMVMVKEKRLKMKKHIKNSEKLSDSVSWSSSIVSYSWSIPCDRSIYRSFFFSPSFVKSWSQLCWSTLCVKSYLKNYTNEKT